MTLKQQLLLLKLDYCCVHCLFQRLHNELKDAVKEFIQDKSPEFTPLNEEQNNENPNFENVNEQETKGIDKIPLLGDIPVIGFFFRSSSLSRSKSEFIVMVTPRILFDEEDLITYKKKVNNQNVIQSGL